MRRISLALLSTAVLVGPACGDTRPSDDSGRIGLPAGDDTTVTSVVDGDTIVVDGEERVRLIGIDTPETNDPRRPVQCFGAEASARLGSVLAVGTPVRLAYDVERTDSYDRTLAYVYRRADDLFVNAALVRDGYAAAYTVPPNVAHADEMVALERDARDAGRGLWSACGAGDPSGPCDAAYPGVCIPSPPPDLDCVDIGDRRFAVVAPDPHRFDSDGNGVGCEQ